MGSCWDYIRSCARCKRRIKGGYRPLHELEIPLSTELYNLLKTKSGVYIYNIVILMYIIPIYYNYIAISGVNSPYLNHFIKMIIN